MEEGYSTLRRHWEEREEPPVEAEEGQATGDKRLYLVLKIQHLNLQVALVNRGLLEVNQLLQQYLEQL